MAGPRQKIDPAWHDCLRALYVGGLTQRQIAEALGVSKSRITQVCNSYEHVKQDGKWQVRKVPLSGKGDQQ